MFGLSLLSPWFLLGLVAAAGPLLLHLFARENAPVSTLPTMRFVPRAPVEQTRRRRLQDLWLLLLRLTALVLLAVAFARPFFAQPAASSQVALGIVAVDTSFSMAGGDRAEQARRVAREAVESMPGGTRVALMAFDGEARVVVAPTTGRREVLAALDGLEPTYGSTNVAAVVRGAIDLARRQPTRLVLVTDGQRSGVDREALPMLPDGLEVVVEQVPAAVENLSIDTLGRVDGTLAALVRNHGLTPRTSRIRWTIDGRVQRSASVDLPAGAAVEVSLASRAPARGVLGASVEDATGLPADNERFFVADPPLPLPVIVVTSVDGPREAALYLQAALDAVADGARTVQVTMMAADDPRLDDGAALAGARAFVIVGTRGLDRRARLAIRSSVADGRGLFVAAGPDIEPGVVRELLSPAGDGIGDTPPAVGEPTSLAATEARHPILAALDDTTANLGQVRVEGAWLLRDLPGALTLMRYSSGAPALVETLVGRGRAVLLTTDLGRRWNTWPLHPTFVPFVVEAVRHVSDERSHRRDLLVSGETVETARPGVITLSSTGERAAVNVDPRESRLETVSAHELAAGFERMSQSEPPAQVQQEREEGQALWRYALIAVVIVLLAEGLIAARPRRAAVFAEIIGAEAGTGGARS